MPRTRLPRRHRRPVPILLFLLVSVPAVACGSVAPGSLAPGSATLPATPSQTSVQTAEPGSAGPTPQPTVTCAAATLDAMTEEQRIGQLFLLGIDGDKLSAEETAAFATYHFGSAWLVNWRTRGVDGVRPLANEIQALATASTTDGVPFFVGADQEGGKVQRITGPGFSTIPSATKQGALSPEILQSDAETWGRELRAAGVNLNFAPVMDVVPPGADTTNAPIGALQREFGHDPATVGSHGVAVVRGMQQAGVATTLKHFPGLGRVVGNTDTTAGVVDSVTTADDPYLEAFRAGIGAGAPMVMVSLATYTAIDPNRQAVFSPTIIEDLLRKQLGFDGVVVSDDLGAAASIAATPAGGRAVGFIAAGGDLIVVAGTAPAVEMAAAVSKRAASDAGFRAQVDAAALRVLRAKSSYGLLACGSVAA
ncbi:MAG: glycoside hydrolase family 3 N-terminal domain-containing protein [Candidatus Limnocylindrales bacterium]